MTSGCSPLPFLVSATFLLAEDFEGANSFGGELDFFDADFEGFIVSTLTLLDFEISFLETESEADCFEFTGLVTLATGFACFFSTFAFAMVEDDFATFFVETGDFLEVEDANGFTCFLVVT
ncbi:MAG: hypothetical protein ACO3EO_08300, partial [Candidatus Kapaibacteriota bacterium]